MPPPNSAIIARLRQMLLVCGSQRKTAEALGISQGYLADLLSGHRKPGKKVLEVLGFRKVVKYEEA